MDLPPDTTRAVVADITGDGKPRLLTLGADGTLSVHKIAAGAAEGKPEKEASVALGKDATKFLVGRFAKGKPALIVAPGGTFYWDNNKFAQKPALEQELGNGMTGSFRRKDGFEAFFVFSPGAPPSSYVVDLSAEKIYQPGPELPEPTAEGSPLREMVVNFPRAFFEQMSFPDEVKAGSLARLFDPRGQDKLFGLFAWQAADGSYVAVVEGSSLFPRPRADAKPSWKSAKLAGKVLDIALGADVKGTEQTGFYVLQEAGAEQKERVLEFFALD
jgi:hypothetical protein